jgi:ComEC/Rec2-related protein
MTRKALWFCVSWLIGIAVSAAFQSLYLVYTGVILAAGSLIISICFNGNKQISKITFFVVSFAIALTFSQSYHELSYNSIMAFDNIETTVTGKLKSTEYYGENAYIIVDGKINNKTPATISAYVNNVQQEMHIGDSVTLSGKLTVPRNNYLFNADNYYKTKQIFLQIPYAKDLVVTENNDNSFAKFAENYREKLYGIIRNSIINRDDSSLFIAMLFGDRDGITKSQNRFISRAGISHIMAVSGAQLAIICTAVIVICESFGVGKKASFFIMLIPLTIFILLAESSVSITRSAIMVLFTYGSALFSRRADTANSLAISCVVITAANPYAITDASFLLSAGGVFALAVIFPKIVEKRRKTAEEIRQERKSKDKKKSNILSKFINSIYEIFLSSLVISLTLLPICFVYFDEVSIISPLTNLIMIPLSSVVVLLGMIVVMCGGIAFISAPILFLCGKFCAFAWDITYFCGKFKYASIPMGYSFEKPFLLIILAVLVLFWIVVKSSQKTKIISYLCTVFVFISVVFVYRFIPSETKFVTIIGDEKSSAVILHDKFSASIIDINGGGEIAESVYRYLIRYGINDIEKIILTEKVNTAYPIYLSTFKTLKKSNVYIPKLSYSLDGTTYSDSENINIFDKIMLFIFDDDYYIDAKTAAINIVSGEYINTNENVPKQTIFYNDSRANNISNSDTIVMLNPAGIVYADTKTNVIIGKNVTFILSEKIRCETF